VEGTLAGDLRRHGENQGAQIYDFNTTTKEITLANAVDSTPATAASYLIADDY